MNFPACLRLPLPSPHKTVYLMLYNVVMFMKLICIFQQTIIYICMYNLYTYFPTNFYLCMLFLKFAQKSVQSSEINTNLHLDWFIISLIFQHLKIFHNKLMKNTIIILWSKEYRQLPPPLQQLFIWPGLETAGAS